MRARRTAGLVTAAAVAAGLTVFAPQAALADNPAPDCTQGGSAGISNIYFVFCSYSVAGTWSGVPIQTGQGTARIKGQCVVGRSEPYLITVSWVDSSGTAQTSATAVFDCTGSL